MNTVHIIELINNYVKCWKRTRVFLFCDAGDLPTFKKFEREVQKPLGRWLIFFFNFKLPANCLPCSKNRFSTVSRSWIRESAVGCTEVYIKIGKYLIIVVVPTDVLVERNWVLTLYFSSLICDF